MERPSLFRQVIRFVFNLFCCGWMDTHTRREHMLFVDGPERRERRHIRSRPLQDVAEGNSLLDSHPSDDCHRYGSHMSAQERQFKAMKIPSFTTKPCSGKSMDEDGCLICLEDFTDDNPRILLACAHGFHLGCMLEWQERGKTECPVCDITVGFSKCAKMPGTLL
jgi:hypothetical protein